MPVRAPKFAPTAAAPVAPVQQTLAPIAAPAPGPASAADDYITADQLASRQAYADALLADSMKPVGDWTQGVGNMVKAFVGGRVRKKAEDADKAGKEAGLKRSSAIMAALLGGDVAASPSDRLNAIGGPEALQGFLADPNVDPQTKEYVYKLLGERPAPPEPYTLKPGEHRFEGNQEVASVPETPPEPDPFTLGPGQQRFDAEGNPIAGVPSNDLTFEQRLELEKAGRPVTSNTVTVEGQKYQLPPPPAGFVYRMNPQTGEPALNGQGLPELVPTPGGDVAREREEASAAATKSGNRTDAQTNVVIEDIDRAISNIEANPGGTTGVGGSLLKLVPGSQADNVQNLLSTLTANATLENLNALRDRAKAAGATGAGLGQVTEKELTILKQTIGSVEQSQSSDQLLYNLRRARNAYLDTIYGPGAGPPRIPLGDNPEGTNAAPAAPDAEGWVTMPDGGRIREVK